MARQGRIDAQGRTG